jgi:hypothetical protein
VHHDDVKKKRLVRKVKCGDEDDVEGDGKSSHGTKSSGS